jgi:hypothetical protein
MKKTLSLLVVAGVFLAMPVLSAFADAQGNQIAKAYFDLKKAHDTSAEATMVILDRDGNKKIRKLEMWTRETADTKDALTKFLQPADVAGTKFLTISRRGEPTDQRLYLPALGKTRKIASSDKSGKFVNSDFFYYDLEPRYYGDDTYTFLSSGETLPDYPGMTFSKIELKAKSQECPYSKSVAWVNDDNHFIYRLDVFNKDDGGLWKTIKFGKVKDIDGVLIPTETLVINHRDSSKTLMTIQDLRVNEGVSSGLFSVKGLEE